MLEQINSDFIIRFLSITLIDIALSGDNAIVIGMAAAALPPKKRKAAIILGGTLAVVLRIALTAIASYLLLIPFLSAAGGIALIWVVYRLLKLDSAPGESVKSAGNLKQAIILILAADFMMSVDNVIAVAGSAHGNVFLLVAGLLISMPLLMVAGGFISSLIDKAKWLVFVGAAAISFTAVRMVFEDKMVDRYLHMTGSLVIFIAVIAAALIPGGFFMLNRKLARKIGQVEKSALDGLHAMQDMVDGGGQAAGILEGSEDQ